MFVALVEAPTDSARVVNWLTGLLVAQAHQHHWLPVVPDFVMTLVIGFVVSCAWALARRKWGEPSTIAVAVTPAVATSVGVQRVEGEIDVQPVKPPNILHVIGPAAITAILGGLPGLLLGAAGNGLRMAGVALIKGLFRKK